MMKKEQLFGKDHIKYINENAVGIFSKLNWESGKWPSCIRESLLQHRIYLIKCVEERKKIKSDKLKVCEKCGVELDEIDISHYVSYCHRCFKRKYIDAVCVKPRPRGVCL